MTLFFDHAGPMIRYTDGVLRMDDLNPQSTMRWRMSRLEMLALGWRCIVAALRR
jgi:hypothetical protein